LEYADPMAPDPTICLPWNEPDLLAAPENPELSEAALIARAAADPQAFAALYRTHYSGIARYLFRRTGDSHKTEDLLNEVFLAAFRGLGGFRARGIPFRYWLYRIATNVANRDSARRLPAARPLETAAGAAAPNVTNPELDDKQRAALAALRSLGAKHQAVLSLHYLQELKVEEIAIVLGCSAGTVKSRLARARVALAARIQTHKS
jgi:RNA polymerase sigma-70 factor (ECF subfamily)